MSPAVNDLVFFDYPHQIDPRAPFDSEHELMEVGGCHLSMGKRLDVRSNAEFSTRPSKCTMSSNVFIKFQRILSSYGVKHSVSLIEISAITDWDRLLGFEVSSRVASSLPPFVSPMKVSFLPEKLDLEDEEGQDEYGACVEPRLDEHESEPPRYQHHPKLKKFLLVGINCRFARCTYVG